MFDYPQYYLPFSWESSLAWKRKEKKNFSLRPLCEFNDLIYDYKGGNVSRGTWRKPTEDKIIKQDIGNTLREKRWCDWARGWSTIKGLFFCAVPQLKRDTSEGGEKWTAWLCFQAFTEENAALFLCFLQLEVNYLQIITSQKGKELRIGLKCQQKSVSCHILTTDLIINYLNSSFHLQKYFRI